MQPIDRRTFLMLGAGSLLAACDSQGPQAARPVLRFAERKNETLERVLFRHTAMDTPDARRLAGRALPSYHISRQVPVWDESVRGRWTLEVAGLVRRPIAADADPAGGAAIRGTAGGPLLRGGVDRDDHVAGGAPEHAGPDGGNDAGS